MEFRPFGKDPKGRKIQDVSGLTIRANVEYLQECVAHEKGPHAGAESVQQLVTLLNERIADPAFHVSSDFLKNPWHGYSYEFAMYLSELCTRLSGDPQFHFNLGRIKFLSPIIQSLGRPFSIVQIYKMYPYFVEKFTKGSLIPEVVSISDRTAVMRLTLSPHTIQQFGRYRLACADRICQTTKATIAETPARMFGLRPATIDERCCMGDGADYCEWTFSWDAQRARMPVGALAALASGVTLFVLLSWLSPDLSLWLTGGFAVLCGLVVWNTHKRHIDRQAIDEQRGIIQEQLRSVETRHEELRDAYVEQEHSVVQLRKGLQELTMLHRIGLELGASLDRETVLNTALSSVVAQLHFDRAMISFFDAERRVAHGAHVAGVSRELADLASRMEVPVTDPQSPEGQVLLQGLPLIANDADAIAPRLHALNQQLVSAFHTKAFAAMPLKIGAKILGSLVVDRLTADPFTPGDVNLLATVATQIALALDNAEAYTQIEQLNLGLEAKVKERTQELELANRQLATANARLRELDTVKSKFLSHCSHELRTPLTSIKGFTENLLQGLAGPLSDKQTVYLDRVKTNADRLTRMIADLLDLSRIEAGKLQMRFEEVSLPALVGDVVAQLQPLAEGKRLKLEVLHTVMDLKLVADPDRLTQILTNIVHNAIKFTPEHGAITLGTQPRPPRHVSISIADTGTGIPQAAIPNLFDPFFQSQRQHEVAVKGLGLGLSIVKSLVDLHKGSIRVQSVEGRGTTFTITLPLNPTVD